MASVVFTRLFFDEAVSWCRGKNWQVRLPILVWFGYVLIRHFCDPAYGSIIAPLNLGIHELGHVIFALLGKTLGVFGGTLLQLAAPVFGMVNFYRQQDFFAISLSFGWLSTNLFDVARYAADARAMEIPLVSLFGAEDVVHDWNYLLGRVGLLQFDTALGFIIRVLAALSMFICLAYGAWLLWQMREGSAAVKAN